MSSLLTASSNPRDEFLDQILPTGTPQFCREVKVASITWGEAFRLRTPTQQDAKNGIKQVVGDMACKAACNLTSGEQAQQVADRVQEQLHTHLDRSIDLISNKSLLPFMGKGLERTVAEVLEHLDESTCCDLCQQSNCRKFDRVYFLKVNTNNQLRKRCCGKWICKDCSTQRFMQDKPLECPFCGQKMPPCEQLIALEPDFKKKTQKCRIFIAMLVTSRNGEREIPLQFMATLDQRLFLAKLETLAKEGLKSLEAKKLEEKPPEGFTCTMTPRLQKHIAQTQ